MKKVISICSFGIVFFLGGLAWGDDANCTIKIEKKMKNGRVLMEEQAITVKAKEDCQKRAKEITQNYDRSIVQEISAKHYWRQVVEQSQ